LLREKKVTKEKATPTIGLFLRCSEKSGTKKTRYAQTVFRSDRFFLPLLGANQRAPVDPIFDRFAMRTARTRCKHLGESSHVVLSMRERYKRNVYGKLVGRNTDTRTTVYTFENFFVRSVLIKVNEAVNMIPQFKQDFWLLSREAKGYYAWADKERWRLHRAIRRNWRRCGMCEDIEDSRQLVEALFEEGLGFHPLLDIAFEAFARAEARLALRFIPQRSNEERLTGHLISELEAAIHMVADSFAAKSLERYGEAKQIDFAYYDLSQGGHIEKETGGDLALILSVDLPDRPKLVSYAAIQAKRLSGSTQLDKRQYDTLTRNFDSAATYLFYDCDLSTLAPPMIFSAQVLKEKRNAKDSTASFVTDQSQVFRDALPLSLWLVTQLGIGKAGATTRDFSSALRRFQSSEQRARTNEGDSAISRLAMISIGRPFNVSRDIEAGLRIAL
jgi:hypothetical protein